MAMDPSQMGGGGAGPMASSMTSGGPSGVAESGGMPPGLAAAMMSHAKPGKKAKHRRHGRHGKASHRTKARK